MSSSVVEHPKFRLLTDPKNTFTLFPVLNEDVYQLYKGHLSVFWTVEEVDLVKDKQDWETLSDNERHFITSILAFFAASDGIVAKNLDLNFSDEIVIYMLIPGLDLIRLFFKRILQKRNPLSPDRFHLHHLLLLKFSYNKTLIILVILIIIPLLLNLLNLNKLLIIIISTIIYSILIIFSENKKKL